MKPGLLFSNFQRKWILPALITAGGTGLLLLITHPKLLIGDSSYISEALHESFAVHSTIEAIIGITSMLLGYSLWYRKTKTKHENLRLISFGLLPMGSLALIHSVITQPNEFVFIYSASMLAGAVGFFLCWFPGLNRIEFNEVWTPRVLIIVSAIFGLSAFFTSSFGLVMIDGISFTAAAGLINILSGILFTAGAFKLFSESFSSGKDRVQALLGIIAVTGATAGLTFPLSHAWSHGWWTHHLIRLTIFIITLVVLQKMASQLESEKEKALREIFELSSELKTKEERLSLAMEAARDGIWDWDLESNELYYSPAWSGMLGYQENELLGSLEIWESLVHPEDIDNAKRVIEDYMTGRLPVYSMEFRMKHKNGHYLNILSRGKMIRRESDQKPIRFIGTHSDLTEIRQAEKDLHIFKILVEKSSHGCGLYTLEGKVSYMNSSLLGFLKIDNLKDAMGLEVSGFYPEDVRQKISSEVIPQVMDKGYWSGESLLKAADNSTLPIMENFFLVKDSKGKPICLANVIVDISQIKQTMAALEENEARLTEFFDMTNELVTQVDQNGNFLFVNNAAGRIYGISPDQCLGRPAFDFIHPDDRSQTQESFQKWIKEKQTNVSFENRQVSANGQIFEMLWSINPKYDDAGKLLHIWSVARDISEIKTYEKELNAAHNKITAEKRFSDTLINSLPGVFYLFDEQMKFRLWNKNFEKVTGYSSDELGELSPLDLFSQEESSQVAGRIGEAFRKGRSSVEADFISKNGTRIPYYLTGLHIDIDGESFLLGVGVDIGERKKLEFEREHMLGELRERIKEQVCIFEVSEAVKSSTSVDTLIEKSITAIGKGWQFPDLTRCRILLDGNVYVNTPFKPTKHKIAADIVVKNEIRGSIEVFYLETGPETGKIPFLPEEETLLDLIADRLGEAIALYQSETDRKARREISEGFNDPDDDKAYSKALQATLQATGSTYGMLGYIDEEGAGVYPGPANKTQGKSSEIHEARRLPTDSWEGLWGESLVQKKIFSSNQPIPVIKGWPPIQNMITSPVLLKDQLVGHLLVANKDSDYTKSDVVLLQKLAEYIAPIIEARRQQKFADQALEGERIKLRTLFDSTDDIIYVSDPDTYELLYVNGAFSNIWGEDVEGKKCYKILQDRESPCPFCTNDRIFGENLGKTYVWDFQNEKTRQWFRCADKAITWSDGRQVRFELATDITESKLFAQEQVRMEKLSALGQVAAGVAHELNNPLMGVLNYAQYCLTKTDTDDRRHSVLLDIENETKRCARIVENLLSASRMDDVVSGRIMEFNPEKVVDRVISLLEYRSSKEKIDVVKKTGKNIPSLKMSRDAFQQLFMNLFTNAMDSVESSSEKQISIEMLGKADQLIVIVSDTGCGIPHDLKEKIFDPFYTTKPPGKGTGLGLATCLKVIGSQGGLIDCQSRPGFGTTMTITLPREAVKGRYQS